MIYSYFVANRRLKITCKRNDRYADVLTGARALIASSWPFFTTMLACGCHGQV